MTNCGAWQRSGRRVKGLAQMLQATALVHEAYLRLVDGERNLRWASRGHFLPWLPRPCGGSWLKTPVGNRPRFAAADNRISRWPRAT